MAGEIQTSQLADGILSADAEGRGKVATDFLNEATFDAKVAAAAVDDDRLKSLGATRALGGRDIGRLCVGYFYLTGVGQDGEQVVINGRSYEFDVPPDGIAGNVLVDINADQTADAAITVLAAAINGDGTAVVEALVWAGNNDTTAGLSLVANAAGATDFTLTTDAANGVVSAATLADAAAFTNRDVWAGQYVITAADVLTLARGGGNTVVIAGFEDTNPPNLVGLVGRNSSGIVKSLATLDFSFGQPNSNFWILTVDDGIALLAAGDIIGFTVATG